MKKRQQVILHQILKQLLAKAQLTARKLSAETEIPASTISTYLSGEKSSYDPQHLLILSSYFKVSIDYLLFGAKQDETAVRDRLEEIRAGYFEIILRPFVK